jgi:hypothetical protein
VPAYNIKHFYATDMPSGESQANMACSRLYALWVQQQTPGAGDAVARGKDGKPKASVEGQEQTSVECRAAMTSV